MTTCQKSDLTQLRIDSAKALGKEVFTPPGHWPDHAKGDVVIRQPDRSLHVWAPDLEGHEAQLVELIKHVKLEIMHSDADETWWVSHKKRRAVGDADLGVTIMRAVAEVGNDN